MPSKPTFNVVVLQNNMQWASLGSKLAAVASFYAPVCQLTFTVVNTHLRPIFAPDGGTGIYIVDKGWYDVNVATPYAGSADIIIFVTPDADHPNLPTYLGVMTMNNVGPWEITLFANGENDQTYMNGESLGNSFELYVCHEISHAFYYYCGERDDTHVHFPVNQDPYTDHPANVLKDFDFSQRYPALEYLKEKCMQILVNLRMLSKSPVVTVKQ